MRENDLVLLVTVYPPEDTIIEGRLKAAGIPTVTVKEAIATVQGIAIGPLAEVRIYVPAEEAEVAREVLQAVAGDEETEEVFPDMQEIPYHEMAKQMLEQLPKGAFLTVKDREGRVNTMTIGWGTLGYVWRRPIFMVMVRLSRYTYELMENADDFTVSIPFAGEFKKELAGCGTRSGREMDKIKEYGLSLEPSTRVSSPVIGGCALYYECRIVMKQLMEEENIDPELMDLYRDKDYHTMYFGEIVATRISTKED